MKKRIFTLILAFGILFTLCSCNGTQKNDKLEEKETRTITDAVGRNVDVPVNVERIVPLGNTPRMISYLGLADKVVGIGECEIATSPIQAYAYPYKDVWSKLPVCGTDAMGETSYYAEEIILAKPDVILCTYTSDVADDIQKQTGIPTIAVAQGTLFGKDYEEALTILGDVCGASEKAKSLIKFTNECLEDLHNRTKNIPDDNKPTVLGAGATFKGSHSIDGVYIDYPVFKAIGANDLAKDTTGTNPMAVMVDKEQILKWNPDIIFFDAGSMELVNADYTKTPNYFKQLKAVQNGKLYQWPNSTWHWSNVEIPLVSAYFTGALLYPEQFKDVNFEAKASEIFDEFLGLPDYLKVLEKAGAGYTQVVLGE